MLSSSNSKWIWGFRLLPILLGAGVGYAYYYFIGCVSGTCPISSNPWISTSYGMLMGFFWVPWRKSTGNDTKSIN